MNTFTPEEYTQAVQFLQGAFGKHQPCDIKPESSMPGTPAAAHYSCRTRRYSEDAFGTCCENCNHLTPTGCGTINLMCLTFVCPAVETILDLIDPQIMHEVTRIRDRISEICHSQKISSMSLYYKSEAEVKAILLK